jgi:hypothetical protein
MANKKSIGKTSKYWGVSFMSPSGAHDRWKSSMDEKPWRVHIATKTGGIRKTFATEREAAIHADMINLELNLGKPLNILKPKP